MAERDTETLVDTVVASLDQDARGVARIDGKVTFIDGALPGERVRVALRRRKRRFDLARTVTVLEASADRVAARCPHFGVCGGCSLQHLDGAAQIEHKQRDLLDKLLHIARVRPLAVAPPLRGPQWGYRRKARLGCRYVPGKGGVLVGFRERRANLVADIGECHVLPPRVGTRIRELRAVLSELEIRDAVPQLELVAGDAPPLLLLRHLRPLAAADRERLRAFAREHGIGIALQPAGPDSVVALEPDPLPCTSYRLPAFDLELAFGPLDFVQVNGAVNESLVTHAVQALDPAPGESVLDLYCGLGNFSLALARSGARVTGVELGEHMVARARANAELNGIEGAAFHAGDLSRPEVAARWARSGAASWLLDPPRGGAQALVAALGPDAPRCIVYVSCNPATLARDAGALVHEHGFELAQVSVVDMFPHTNHVESLAVFRRAS
jgi:23S rRNA (uracil1939-C5)-methyltransferase